MATEEEKVTAPEEEKVTAPEEEKATAPNEEKVSMISTDVLYQVASERFNVIEQQAQTAISISSVATTAVAAAIGVIFSSLAPEKPIYRFYAGCLIIVLSVLAATISYVCKRILDDITEVSKQYSEKLKEFEAQHSLTFMPNGEFLNQWGKAFRKYEPNKMTSRMLTISIFMCIVFIIASGVNIVYLFRNGLELF